MAEKETVIIETEFKTKGEEETGDKFVRLQARIRETRIELQKAAEAGDQLRFDQLKNELDDLEESLAATNIRSKNFAQILSTLPGPLGNIASQAGSAVDQLKAFSKVSLNDLKSSINLFTQDLGAALTTLGNVSGITKAYTTLNNFLAASFVRIGIAEGAATTGARAFAVALTATGVGAIVVALGALYVVFERLANAEENAAEQAKQYEDSLKRQKEALDNLITARGKATDIEIARLRQAGATEEQINKARIANAEANLTLRKQDIQFLDQDLKGKKAELAVIEKQSTVRKNLTGTIVDESRLRKEIAALEAQRATAVTSQTDAELDLENIRAEIAEKNRQRIKQDGDEAARQRAKDLADIKENSRQAGLQLLSDRDRDIAEVNYKYDQQVALAKKYKRDTTVLEAARKQEIADINAKYDADDEKKRKDKEEKALKEYQEYLQEEFELLKYQLDLRFQFGLIAEADYQDALFMLRAQYAEKNKEIQDAELDGVKFYMDKVKEYGKQQEDINKEITQSYFDLGDNIATVFSRTATLFEQGSAAAKVFGVLSVVANAASGIAQAVIKNQEAQAAYNKTIAEGVAGVASAGILLTNPVTAALGAARLIASKAAIATATAGKATSATAAKIQIGTIAATSALQIAAILSAKKSTAGSASAGAAGGGGGGTTTIGLGPTVGAPQVGAGAFNQQGQIAGIVAGSIAANQSTGRPIRAYVVGNDITTEQQLDRRLRTAARLGG